ncbi:magnesium-dependent phosphatase-1 family protein [Purpureocillium lavendulum]|uniref:Magnesium-dependent phosphatase-1 family protein n=1 Tax=Purpureocillium lavendulum TaxID=1247861 RepID=A0AB34G1G7_9HYPO|nr:magnesium-dependent phosphatase-1 family protein [Purpureocillium lavendulum]
MPSLPRKLSKQSLAFGSSSSSAPASQQQSPTPTSSIPTSLADGSRPLPKLIVFDLDYTLWPFWVDTHVTPPLKPNAQHSGATDKFGEDFAFYGDVPAILLTLPAALPSPVKLGVASRTSAPSLARDLLKMLHLRLGGGGDGGAAEGGDNSSGGGGKPRRALDVFDGGLEIYPGSKIRHFESLHKRTGIRYEDMLFFDDESRNQETERLGVTMRLVRDGVTWDEIEQGVEEWRRRRGYAMKK